MPTVPELKEEMVRLGLDWKQGDNKAVLEERIRNHMTTATEEDYENTTPDDGVSGEGDTSNSVAPDPTEAPDYIGTAELKSQVLAPSSTSGSDIEPPFKDPNWGNK